MEKESLCEAGRLNNIFNNGLGVPLLIDLYYPASSVVYTFVSADIRGGGLLIWSRIWFSTEQLL